MWQSHILNSKVFISEAYPIGYFNFLKIKHIGSFLVARRKLFIFKKLNMCSQRLDTGDPAAMQLHYLKS